MPELPEVETVARGLQAALPDVKILAVKILSPSSIGASAAAPRATSFAKKLIGATFISVNRRGKFLLYQLSNDLVMVQHLRMSGQMLLVAADFPRSNFLRIYFELSSGQQLRFNDQRRFGRLWLFSSKGAAEFLASKNLGPEPLAGDWKLSDFQRQLKNRSKNIKATLLDQQVVAGIGNIYADESLFASGIHPERASNSLSPSEIERLHKNAVAVLREAVHQRGTSFDSYRDSLGRPGNYIALLKVYNRKNQACVTCNNPIQYTRVAQRGTHFCSHCQK